VVFTSLFAVGVIMITRAADHIDLDPGCVLYGLIEFVPLDTVHVLGLEVPRALETLSIALAATLVLVVVFWKEFKIVSFDAQLATTMGINATLFHYLLMTMVAGVTVASFEAVGSILVIAMLIVPAAAAHLLTDRLGWMMLWAVAIGLVSAVLGYAADRYLHTGVAPMMAVAAGMQFALAVFFAPRHGVASKLLHNLSLAARIVREDILAQLYRGEEKEQARSRPIGQCLQAAHAGWLGWLVLPQLWRRGQVALVPGWELELTAAGRAAAQSLVRSHRLWESYLEEHFELPLDHLHDAAERVEHFIGPDLQEQLASEVHTADRDPHGRAIPPPPE
jgi:manganese/zinc/iron transport system permease protein